jgi:deoxyribodipyrimidine photo-lyase
MKSATAIWWIRRDLRLMDNQALAAALSAADSVVPLFVADPQLLGSATASAARIGFMSDALRSLDSALRNRGSKLVVRSGDPTRIVPEVAREANADVVFAEADHTPFARQRDHRVAQRVQLQLTDGVAIRKVGSVLKQDGRPYTVFTPFSRKWKEGWFPPSGVVVSERPSTIPMHIDLPSDHGLLPSRLAQSVPFPPSEEEAFSRLAMFVRGYNAPIYDYANQRDRPDLDATSQLSPYLRFGLLSPRLVALKAANAIQSAPDEESRRGAETWLNELIWRDFYINVLHHFPHARSQNFRAEYDRMAWDNNVELFEAWCQGNTGYPFIDAAMRQLTATGWMHNRARMVVASFLVKDLLIDWRWGERWFMQKLVDGDPAANSGGWQWAAGTGTDAAPYFRIFNPVTQGQKHDKMGAFTRHWVPELANVPLKWLQTPWQLPMNEQIRTCCRIGSTYPAPIVDHAWARQRTLAAYSAARLAG